MTFVVSVVFATARTLNVAASEGGVHKAMTEPFISRGFRGRGRHGATAARLPPGQYETPDFPVLSAGPTPRTPVATWDFLLRGADGPAARWTWDEFQALPHETVNTDIHCVTKWSKLDTIWEGVSVDTLLAEAAVRARGVRRRLHNEPVAGGRGRWQGMGGGAIPGCGAYARARRPRAPAGAAPLLLEERQVGAAVAIHGARHGRILGIVRLSRSEEHTSEL